jgi:DNA-binding Lrp family transcriptional regulator
VRMNQPSEPASAKQGFAEGWRAAVVELAISYAVNHPIRLDCLAILIVRIASASEIAKELGISTSSAAHHITELHKDGVIEYVKTEVGGSRRGASEHFYRATALPEVTEEDWLVMPLDGRRQMAGRVLQAIVAQSLAALRCQTMESDDRLHLGWQAIEVDEEGEDEVAGLLEETSEHFKQVKARNLARLKAKGEEGKVRIVATMGFYRADPGEWPGRPEPL